MQRYKVMIFSPLFVCLFSLILIGCDNGSADAPTSTTAPTDVVAQVETPNAPTQTRAPTAAPSATSTDIAPTTVPNTATPIPSRTPRPSPTILPTPTPVVLKSWRVINAAGNINRFTGLEVADPETLNRRPVLCKISNWPKEWVRPQSGLNSADIVIEHMTEGTLTRFSALFYGETPPKIGPVRSARLVDIQLTRMFDAVLCYSGASIGVTAQLEAADFRKRLTSSYWDGYYRLDDETIPYEHTFYAELDPMRDKLAELNRNDPPTLASQQTFASKSPPKGTPTDYVLVDYTDATFVEWRWSAEQAAWLRWADDEPIIDANDEQQVAVENVIVIFAEHDKDERVCDHAPGDFNCLLGATRINLLDSGRGTLLRDGNRYAVRWTRQANAEMITLSDWATNRPIPLQVGQSWIQLVPVSFEDRVSFTEN